MCLFSMHSPLTNVQSLSQSGLATEEFCCDTATWGGGGVLALLPPVVLSLGWTCSHYAVSAPSTAPVTSLCLRSSQLLSPSIASLDSVPFTVPMAPRVREVTAPSPGSSTVPGSQRWLGVWPCWGGGNRDTSGH